MLLFFSFLECVYTFLSLPKQNPYLWGENVILQLLSMCLTLREDATVHSEIEFTAYRCTLSLQSIPFVLTDDTSVSFLSRLGCPLTSQEKKKKICLTSVHIWLSPNNLLSRLTEVPKKKGWQGFSAIQKRRLLCKSSWVKRSDLHEIAVHQFTVHQVTCEVAAGLQTAWLSSVSLNLWVRGYLCFKSPARIVRCSGSVSIPSILLLAWKCWKCF